jgi:hypothetical protein
MYDANSASTIFVLYSSSAYDKAAFIQPRFTHNSAVKTQPGKSAPNILLAKESGPSKVLCKSVLRSDISKAPSVYIAFASNETSGA